MVHSSFVLRHPTFVVCLSVLGLLPIGDCSAVPDARPVLYVWSSQMDAEGKSRCRSCSRFWRDLQTVPGFAEALRERYRVQYVNYDAQPERARLAGVRHLPTFIPGDRRERIVGYTSPADLLDRLGISQRDVHNADDGTDASETAPSDHAGSQPATCDERSGGVRPSLTAIAGGVARSFVEGGGTPIGLGVTAAGWMLARAVRRRKSRRQKTEASRQNAAGEPAPAEEARQPDRSQIASHPSLPCDCDELRSELEQTRNSLTEGRRAAASRPTQYQTVVDDSGLERMRRAMKLVIEQYPSARAYVEQAEQHYRLLESGER